MSARLLLLICRICQKNKFLGKIFVKLKSSKMLGLCKCCLGYSSLEEKKYGKEAVKTTDSPEIFGLKARLVSSDPMIVVDEPASKQNSSFAEEDSGACCQVCSYFLPKTKAIKVKK